ENDNGNRRIDHFELGKQRERCPIREAIVEHSHVWSRLAPGIFRLAAVAGIRSLKTFQFKESTDRLTPPGIIINNQNSFFRHRQTSAQCMGKLGKSSKNR